MSTAVQTLRAPLLSPDPRQRPRREAIGEAGAANAGILAASMLANTDPGLLAKLDAFRQAQTDAVAETVEDGK